jgi:hypothetical protein
MKNEKKQEITGVGEISYKYRDLPKLNLGLTPDELIFLPEFYFEYLIHNGKVNLQVYRRLKDMKIIEGNIFDVSNVKPYRG